MVVIVNSVPKICCIFAAQYVHFEVDCKGMVNCPLFARELLNHIIKQIG